MSDEAAVATTVEIAEDSWVHSQEGLDDVDKQTLSKYENQGDAIKASAHATRKFAEYDEKIKNSVNWPDEKTSVEDKTTFDGKVNAYRGVPDKVEDYELDRSGVPEGIEYDEEMEKLFRETSLETKADKATATKYYEMYNKLMLARHQAMEKVAKTNEQMLKDDPDFDFDKKLGKEGDKNVGTIKAGLIQLSKDLKLDYKDGEGNPQSHLIDDLEFVQKNGSVGNSAYLTKALDYLLTYRYTEGITVLGDVIQKTKTSNVAMSDDFYDNPEPGGE